MTQKRFEAEHFPLIHRWLAALHAVVIVVIAFCSGATHCAPAAEIEPPPAEVMKLLNRAMRDYETDKIDSADTNLSRFREVLGAAKLPDDLQFLVFDMGVQIAIRKATRVFQGRPGVVDASSAEFTDVWKVVDDRSDELLAYYRRKVSAAEAQEDFSGFVLVSAREQRLRRDRALALQFMTAYPEALSELDEALAIYTRCLPHATETIQVGIHSPDGEERTEQTRGDAFGLATPEVVAQERMTVLGLWLIAAPNDLGVKEMLTSTRERFLKDFPDHPNTYFNTYAVLEARGTLTADALKAVLDSTRDKTSANHASNMISHANRLFLDERRLDEALAEYEVALALPACPKDRLTELYSQMASIHLESKRFDKARECMIEAKRHADPAQAQAFSLDSKLDLIESAAGNRPLPSASAPVANGNRRLFIWLNTLAVLLIGGYYAWKRLSPRRSDHT